MDRMYSPWRETYMQSFKEEKSAASSGKSVFADIPPEEDEERFVLYRGKRCFIIMNLYPYNCGHLMVIPYFQTASFTGLDRETKLEVMELTDLSIRALEKTLKPQGINFGANLGRVAGGSVDTHIHFHIVPRWEGDTNFMPVLAEAKVLSNDMRALYRNLKTAIGECLAEDPS
ncbi:HIT domain-containing protein [Chlorobium phaeovibrioides]|uniref:HIT domain-containing protein n=2 Tax=Chlorobium phaeovibrioides TaxID=1094 RepID=A0A3S0L141_CHLPH|nr:HIT domain-containing protein [Chlorobium phaeovibrioides]HCD37075.1 HIT domain-containing protein [Chlorobium sp.]KAA6232759.1 HIT domain-containing protein [Chlorobium phaeovibrioides]MDT9546699.1 HIT domain-containing protein [Chlorobium phaeovibrioides]MWV54931.1 HIT domain-containing protein [Chlorobium phaeovibrioides]QEQ56827.1 HIT domain-containing protein [Chlorobium phaeovibrioides]